MARTKKETGKTPQKAEAEREQLELVPDHPLDGEFELTVGVSFSVDGKGIEIAPGVVLGHSIPPDFAAELIERGLLRKKGK